jgi:EmrB/QacA subfamily drug resistance transporter
VVALARGRRRVGKRWFVLAIVSSAQFMVALDSTIVNIALPSIQHGLGFSTAGLQWVASAYTLVLGGFVLLGGRLADLVGGRRLYVTGIAIFTVASVIDGVAQSPGMLVGGRLLQGLGAALVLPSGSAITLPLFEEGRSRRRAMGLGTTISLSGTGVGLVVGGLITQALSWRWVFFLNLPVGVGLILLGLRHLPARRHAPESRRPDVAGAATVTSGLLLLVYATAKAQEYGWASWRTVGLYAVAIALLASFTRIESRSPAPLIRLGIFRVRSLAVANGALMLLVAALFAMAFFLSLYVQEVLGYGPRTAGLAFLPFTVGTMAGAGLSQPLIRRVGVRAAASVGLVLTICGELLFSRLSVDASYAGELLPGILALAIGQGLTSIPLSLIAVTRVKPSEAGVIGGFLNTSSQLGGALGLAILSTFAAGRTSHLLASHHARPDALVGGFHLGFGIGAGLVTLALVLLLTFVRGHDVANVDAERRAALGV